MSDSEFEVPRATLGERCSFPPSNTSRGRSNSYSRIGMIFSKGFEGDPVTLSFLTSSTSASNSRGRLSRLEKESRGDRKEG